MLMDKSILYTPPLFLNKAQKVWTPWKNYDHIIFENGQGLLLDKNITGKESLYNTPSNTTTENPVKLLKKWFKAAYTHCDNCTICYVSRTYVTRHGRGALYNEKDISYIEGTTRIFDKTNIPNKWQGSLRYAPLCYVYDERNIYNSIYDRIWESVENHGLTTDLAYNVNPVLFVTHWDELPISGEFLRVIPNKSYKETTVPCTGGLYTSSGPCRTSVKYYKEWEEL